MVAKIKETNTTLKKDVNIVIMIFQNYNYKTCNKKALKSVIAKIISITSLVKCVYFIDFKIKYPYL